MTRFDSTVIPVTGLLEEGFSEARDIPTVCALTQSDYLAKAARDIVVTPNLNPAYVQWVRDRQHG